ncbi:MAG TPA: hypothetical protein VLW85_03670, partial [Myxococcales bacterium]|nr:hypothetical protein [Myxococcales bacterium]
MLWLLAAAQLLESASPITLSLANQALVLRSGASELTLPDVKLPPGPARREGAQWVVGDVFLSMRPLQLGKAPAALLEVLRLPEGAGRALGSWRVVVRAPGGEIKQAAAFGDVDPSMGIGRVTFADDVLHFTHDQRGDPDRFDHAAWDWTGTALRPLSGATVYAVAIAAGPSLDAVRRVQLEVESRCATAGALRSYESARFEGIPQQYFAGKIVLSKQEAKALLDQLRPCAPTAEIFET